MRIVSSQVFLGICLKKGSALLFLDVRIKLCKDYIGFRSMYFELEKFPTTYRK